MKRIATHGLIALLLLFSVPGFAAKGINYQAVARNAAGEPVINATVSLKFTIHDGSATGPVAFQETHSVQTNAFGIIAVVIGGGSIVTGNIDSVNWMNDKYLQVEYDATGGSAFLDMGSTQMLGAPFSAYSNSSNVANNAVTAISAGHAVLADSSLNAGHALLAENAISATNALTANHSLHSDTALIAATSLISDSATNVAHAMLAENATTAAN
ncbi:MAG: hypothetical protein JWO06_2303, partial [Bacteroidota bacterium]|nr:hypothetical protein [Bacteroidota bacterium]